MIEAPFVWAGSKKAHLDHILPHIPANTTRFVDAFGGSGVVLLNTPFHKLDVYNDLNSNVVNFFRVLRDKDTLDELIHKLEMHPHSREQFDVYRASKFDFPDPVDQAVAWYYTIETSFSRLGRHYGRNMQASFETRRVYERLPLFEQVHLRLRHCYIENKNAFEIVREYDDPKTVFYLDPPYTETQHGTYIGPTFGEKDHRALLDLIRTVRGRVILSGEPCSYYDEVDFWDFKEVWPAPVRIKSESRHKGRLECLWVKHSTET